MNSHHKEILCKAISFFTDPPDAELQKVYDSVFPVKIKKNEYLLVAGEIPNRMYINISGLLRLFYIDYNGSEVIKHFCIENTCAISYSAFLLRKESNIYIQALEDTSLLAIEHETYQKLIDGHPCWQRAAQKFAELLFLLKEKKEAAFLLYDAQERYTHFLKDYPNLESRIPQYYVASYIGITPESLSRIRSNFPKS